MAMEHSLRIAIFGLSLRTLNELKEKIHMIVPSHVAIIWSNIAESDLDILMINDLFFDSPNIKNLIKNKNINVLRICNNPEKNSSIENNTLYLPLNHFHSLHQWLDECLNQTLTREIQESVTPTPPQRKQLKVLLQEIANPKNGRIQLFDSQGLLAIADPRSEWIWQNPERLSIQTDLSFNYTYATQNDQVWIGSTIQQDLKQWLWNLLWKSPEFIEICPQSASSFYLKIWPQPRHKADRQDILRMSACFAQGAQISVVATQLNLSEQRVKHFVAACLGTHCGHLIKDTESNYRPQKNQTETEQHFMKKLFGRLRTRLGF